MTALLLSDLPLGVIFAQRAVQPAAIERRKQAVALREQGLSVDKIGAAMGVSGGQALRYLYSAVAMGLMPLEKLQKVNAKPRTPASPKAEAPKGDGEEPEASRSEKKKETDEQFDARRAREKAAARRSPVHITAPDESYKATRAERDFRDRSVELQIERTARISKLPPREEPPPGPKPIAEAEARVLPRKFLAAIRERSSFRAVLEWGRRRLKDLVALFLTRELQVQRVEQVLFDEETPVKRAARLAQLTATDLDRFFLELATTLGTGESVVPLLERWQITFADLPYLFEVRDRLTEQAAA